MQMKPSPSTNGRRENGQPNELDAASQDGRRDSESIETEFRARLDRHPDAPVAAVSAAGVFVDMPKSVPLRENPVLRGRSGLDSVPLEDRDRFIETFDRVLSRGTAQCMIHPSGYGDVIYYGFDLRERHGVIVGMLVRVEEGGPEAIVPPTVIPAGRPRFATIKKDERSFVIGSTAATTEILGWSAEEMVGRRSLDFVHPDDHELAIDNWMEMLAHPGPSRRVRQRLRGKDGSWVWFEITNHNLLEDADHRCVVCEMVDITDEMAAQEALRAREELLNRIAEAIPVGLFQIDTDGAVVYTNDRLHEILGVEPAAAVEEQLATIVPADRPALVQAIAEVLAVGSHADIEIACRPPGSPEPRCCTISFRALSHDDGTISGAIACVADVTESARMREELEHRATFDELTGCHNRASIMAVLEADIGRDRRRAERAVMFVDLDGFKAINDRHGHAVGDGLLRKVARLLRDAVRGRDLVGRIGGDEFLVVCPDVGGADQAMRLAGRLADALRHDICEATGDPSCGVSIGVAWCSGDTLSADALVAAADNAMYDSKRQGTGEPKLAGAAV